MGREARVWPLLASLLLLACRAQQAEQTDTGPPTPFEGPMEHLFSFAVLADPHITSAALEHQERLAAAVAWVNERAGARQLELAVVVGDVGWDGGLPIAKALLDDLSIPYLPILGDNEVHFGDEERFNLVFSETLDALATMTDNHRRALVAVHNPQWEQTSWLQNVSFDYRGVRFMGLDWVSRDPDNPMSEMAELHDFPDGSWPWFADELDGLEAGPDENVLLFSHHPMHLSPGAFDLAEMAVIEGILAPYGGRIAGAYAGHYHFDGEETNSAAGYDVFVTDAVWDDENTVRVVEVYGNGRRFEYVQSLEIVL